MEAAWLEDNGAPGEYEYDMWSNANAYFEECSSYVRPIVTRTYNSSWNLFDRHLYPGELSISIYII
jgi:aminopeptidase N